MIESLRMQWIFFRVGFWEAVDAFAFKLHSKADVMSEPSRLSLLETRLLRLESKCNRLIEVSDGALVLAEELNQRTKELGARWELQGTTLSVNDVKGRIDLLRRDINRCRGSDT